MKEVNRKNLHELVWRETLTNSALELGITVHRLKKICKELKVPVPLAGHWIKVHHGKKIDIPPLDSSYDGQASIDLHPEEENNLQATRERIKEEIDDQHRDLLKVPKKLTKAHPLIQDANKAMGSCHAWWNYGLEGTGSGRLDIRATKDLFNRCYRIFNTIIRVLEERGHKIIIEGHTTYVSVFDNNIEISLREKRNRVLVKGERWDNYDHVPSGKLVFQVGYSYWSKVFEDNKVKLEDKISRIVAFIEYWSLEKTKENIRLEKQWAIQRKKRELEELEKRLREDEEERTRKLFEEVQQWRLAEDLRNFIIAVESVEAENKRSVKWINWAKSKADNVDPLIAD